MAAPAHAAPGMAWLGNQDLHVHTTMSDGALPLERVVSLAGERGVTVGIADHISTLNPRQFISREEQLRDYFAALETQPVFRSGEFCWCDRFWRDLPEELMDRFDYRIGSNHGFWLPDGSVASPWWQSLPAPWDEQPQELMEIMVHNLCDLVATMPVQIVAHSTMLPPAFLDIDPEVHAWWTEQREDRFVEALARSGVALEISNRYRLPHERLLRRAKEAGARFSLGSDGHNERQIARLEWSIETARRIGITEADLFVPERQVHGR